MCRGVNLPDGLKGPINTMNINTFIYRIIKPIGGLQIAKRLTATHPRIFMYHRVNPDGWGGAITCETFRKQVKTIKRDFNPLHLSELLETKTQRHNGRNAVVITFDDGYYDFYDYAFPILAEEQVPATIFVATGFIDGEVWLWPDQIAFLLERAELDTIPIEGLGEVSIKPQWQRAWHQIADHCLRLPNRERLRLIDELSEQLNVDLPKSPPPSCRPLTWQQLRQMQETGIVEVGSHSHTHPVMSRLNSDELAREVTLPKCRLATELGQTKPLFCYPNGQPSDYNSEVKEALKLGGYQFGVAAHPGKKPTQDAFEIKRYPVSRSTMTFEKALYGLTWLAMR